MGTHTHTHTMETHHHNDNNNHDNMKKRAYGWRPQLPDRRDHWFAPASEDAAEPLPATHDLREANAWLPEVYNQGHLGSCTANAIAGAFEYNEARAGYRNDEFMPSRLFIYYNERRMEGSVNTDSGAQIRDGIKSINRLGVCDEKMWPYDISKFTQRPSAQCYREARTERALKYRRVEQNLNDMKRALAVENQPIVFGFSVYESFEGDAVKKTGIMPMPRKGEKLMGGHAVLCCGYDDEKEMFIVRNSWGADWGMDGYFLMPYAFMLDKNSASDFWIVETIDQAPAAPGDERYADMFPALPVTDTTEEEGAAAASESETCAAGSLDEQQQSLVLTGCWASDAQERSIHTAGSVAQITWETHGRVGRVKLMYCVHTWSSMLGSFTTVVESMDNTGSFDWCIPADAAADTRYYVRIESVEDSSVASTSAYFEVRAQ